MKVIIIGAGRMGVRHAIGALSVDNVTKVCLLDADEQSLLRAKDALIQNDFFSKITLEKVSNAPKEKFDLAIIATPAIDRHKVCSLALNFQPEFLLVEKPLGQSLEEVEQLVEFLESQRIPSFVNLNMRLYDFVSTLKTDLKNKPQFNNGPININYSGGTLGIGANGIHYLDLLFYLYDAADAELVGGQIEKNLIPSGRGPQFGDFGGWACINFYDTNRNYLGRSLLELSSTSTVFGGWDIIGSHGRIRLNELESERVDILRKEESTQPVNRYAADYLPPVSLSITSPALSDITAKWISAVVKGEQRLPTLKNSLKVHKLLFDWLSLSKEYKNHFPIT